MLIIPYSTALTLARPPYISYALVAICLLVFTLQRATSITASLAYYPDSWNPITMLSASFAHLNLWHLFGNLIFFIAFAPALEILIGNSLRFIGIILCISVTVGVGYSLWIVITASPNIPAVGFSGVVTGMIGLSAYLMPRARIRVFCWLLVWKTIFVPAWVLAIIYIGLDVWNMLITSSIGGTAFVGHVAGGLAGFACGWLWLGERKFEISDQLNDEIEAMKIEQRHGKTRAEAHRYQKAVDPLIAERKRARDYDKFMGQVYQMVKTHRDSEAVLELLTRYDQQTLFTELEPVFERVYEWGPSRTLACFGRLLIHNLEREQRHGRALFYIECCQNLSPQFALPDLSRVLFYAQMALDTGKPLIARNLVFNAAERYAGQVNAQQCHHLLQKTGLANSL